MATNNRIVETEQARDMLVKFIMSRKLPFTATVADGKHRTTDQNRLQRLWMAEIAEQRGDQTPEEIRAYCKLAFGVPILRRENEAFKKGYDETVKPLPYETKLKLMAEPISLPVTSLMTTKQKTEYLDTIHRNFSQEGIILTNPEDLRRSSLLAAGRAA